MTSTLLSRRDLDFLLYDWLRVDRLAAMPRFAAHDRQSFDATLDLCEQIATERFAPHNKKGDQCEPAFDGEKVAVLPEIKQALRAFIDAGMMAAGAPEALGGMQLPTVVCNAAIAYFMAANTSALNYALLSTANASTVLAHGSEAQIDAFARPVLDGRYFGTMCLSEPQAGSSLSDISTRAVYECESALGPQYRLSGRKMWISGGDQDISENIVHLVLAKVPGADGKLIPGTRGISLFIVPKFLVAEPHQGVRNDVTLAGLNHKMGQRGITNCLLNFGEGTRHRPGGEGGAIGYLLGPLHGGLAVMFHMMNEARVGVGLSATMLGYTGYLHALDYARTRLQGRPVRRGGKAAGDEQVPIIAHADVKRMLLAQKAYTEGALGLLLYCSRMLDIAHHADGAAERQEAGQLLELLTPVAKSWPSQWCLEANSLAIQVHGGYGYTRDYNVEQFYRDNRLNPIHEGSHGIQALDLLGRKVIAADGVALGILGRRVAATCALAGEHPALREYGDALAHAFGRIPDIVRQLWRDGDPERALANASYFLEAFGHVVVAWIWLEQACVAGSSSDDFHAGKRAACRYFFEAELPKVHPQFDLLASETDLFLHMQDNWF